MSTSTTLTEFPTRAAALGAAELTVVVPCYNERPNVAPMIEKLDAALFGIAWEVVYVDDNSSGCVNGANSAGPVAGVAYSCVGGQYDFTP